MTRESGEWRDEGSSGRPVPARVPGFPFPPPEGYGHVVRFYAHDQECLDVIAEFLAPALVAGEAALVFASSEQAKALPAALAAKGVNTPVALERGQLSIHDARAILDRVLSPLGKPDEDLFMRLVGGLIAKVSAGRPVLRAFAGMGTLPWAREDPDGALELERLWNKLGHTVAFSLLCAYPLEAFRGLAARFAQVCDTHDSVIPCEPFRPGAPEAERLRQEAELQLRLVECENGPAEADPSRGKSARDLMDSAPALIWASGPDGRRTFVNRPWLEFTGNDEREELERGGLEGIHPEDKEAVEAAYARAREGRAGFHTEFRYRRRDGAWRWLLNTASPRFGTDGAFLGFVGACIDITERKAVAEQARQSRNLEAVGRLAGGLAHDFNNLLTAINGYSEIGLTLAPEEGPLREFLSEIKRAGERASDLTRQLLAYGRRQVMAAAKFDLNVTLDDMDRMLRRLLGNDIRLERERQAGLGRIQADPGQVQQLMLNLALNAREAMPAGGALTIGTADGIAASGPEQSPRPYVILTVRDDGAGMASEVRTRVFEPFFTTKEEAAESERTGTGLGLSSAYGIVRQSGGFITADGEPGRGSVFRAHFPWIDPEEGAPESVPVDPAARSALVVCADESLRRFLARALATEGFAVAVAGDPASAVALAEALPHPELLIAEDPCAQMRAPALLARLRRRHPALRAFSIPASPEASDLPPASAAEAIHALELPIARDDVLALIRRSFEIPV